MEFIASAIFSASFKIVMLTGVICLIALLLVLLFGTFMADSDSMVGVILNGILCVIPALVMSISGWVFKFAFIVAVISGIFKIIL